MSLPLLNTSKEVITIPTTGKQFKIRPWLIGEEKGLLMAKESNNDDTKKQAVVSLIENCVEGVKFDDLSAFEFEYLFLQLRKISVNHIIDMGIAHEACKHVNKIQINLDTDLMIEGESKNNKIILDEEKSIGVVMREPTAKNFEKMTSFPTKAEKAFFLIRTSIKTIFDAENVYDPKDFSEKELDQWMNSLNRDQVNKIYQYFEGLPYVQVKVHYKCENCHEEVTEMVRGLQSFL